MHFVENTDYEILTPTGFQDFKGLRSLLRNFVLVKTSGGDVKATPDHRFMSAGQEVIAEELKIGDVIDPGVVVTGVERIDGVAMAYDPVGVAGGSVYVAGGLIHHNCDFLGSSGTLISGDKLQHLAFVEPIWTSENEDFRIYAEPEASRKYILTADVSEGVDLDYSVVSVFDVTERPFKHVAVYRSNQVPPEMFAEVIVKIGRRYNDALAIVETNSIGANVAKDLWYEFEYENVVRTVERENGARVSFSGKSRLGVKTTKATKRLGCSTLKSLIETDVMITTDYHAISELSTFIAQGSSWGAENGKHDDVVMTMVLFSWFTQQIEFDDYMSGSINTVLRKAREDAEFGFPQVFFTDGTEEYGEEYDPTMFGLPRPHDSPAPVSEDSWV